MIHVGDTTLFRYAFTYVDQAGAVQPLDLTGADVLQAIFDPPGVAAAFAKTATAGTPETDGIATYQALTTDLSAQGIWTTHAYVHFADGRQYHSDLVQFQVAPNLA